VGCCARVVGVVEVSAAPEFILKGEGRREELTGNRYSMFYPLYPVGMGAEAWLMYRAIGAAGEKSGVLAGVFWVCLGLYVPGKLSLCYVVEGDWERSELRLMWCTGSYKMYTYMIKQRKKALGGEKKAA
jgi:very-long-chain (3R)-3-hydroxyacyl-CoA dehydratase